MTTILASIVIVAVGASVSHAQTRWPPAPWRSVANELTMAVLAPKSTYGLKLISVRGEHIKCGAVHEDLYGTYSGSGGASLQILEGRPYYCGNIGAETLVRHVTIEGHRANLLGCGPPFHCPRTPNALVWEEDHNGMQVIWTKIATTTAIGFARSLSMVPRGGATAARLRMASPSALPKLPTQLLRNRGLEVRPPIVSFTGDGTGYLGGFTGSHSVGVGRRAREGEDVPWAGRLKWSRWTASEASASGAVWLNNGIPDDASGTFYPYTVTVRASGPRGGVFTRLHIRFRYHGQSETEERVAVHRPASSSFSGWEWDIPPRAASLLVGGSAAVQSARTGSAVLTRASWPPAAWKAVAAKLKMPVFAPKKLFGLALEEPIRTTQTTSPEFACREGLTALYRRGAGTLGVSEAQPHPCGQTGAGRLVRHITLGGYRAALHEDCALRPCGFDLEWVGHGISFLVAWKEVSQSQAIALARTVAVVARATTASSPASTGIIAEDEARVANLYGNCRAFSEKGCPFSVATTSDGKENKLYAIDLQRDAGDSCATGVAYFFRGRTLLTSTPKLSPHAGVAPPFAARGLAVVQAMGSARFAVRYEVNPSSRAFCYQYGSDGTDTYVYRWTGSRMMLISGRPPRPPKAFAPG